MKLLRWIFGRRSPDHLRDERDDRLSVSGQAGGAGAGEAATRRVRRASEPASSVPPPPPRAEPPSRRREDLFLRGGGACGGTPPYRPSLEGDVLDKLALKNLAKEAE